jgi:hypothetical protein
MRWITALGLPLALASGACFEDAPPVDDTGATQSSGHECIAGTEGCPCIEGSCIDDLACLSNVCVDAGSTSDDTTGPGPATASSTSTTPETSTSNTTIEPGDTFADGPVTSDSAGGLPPGSPCDPFADLCIMGYACMGVTEDGLYCEAPGQGQQSEPCDSPTCDVGLVCVEVVAFNDCSGMVGCCTVMCDLTGSGDCPMGLMCTYLFDPMLVPEYAHVGVCVANGG